jgi:hypothetical protein
MDLITANGKQVVKCLHCEGIGVCKQSQVMRIYKQERFVRGWGWMHKCSRCGEGGFERDAGFFSMKPENPPQPPVCKVCEGKGFTAI